MTEEQKKQLKEAVCKFIDSLSEYDKCELSLEAELYEDVPQSSYKRFKEGSTFLIFRAIKYNPQNEKKIKNIKHECFPASWEII